MKLRIRGNSLRLRLLQNEVAALIENGEVSEKIEFGNAGLTYAVRLTDESEKISAEFAGDKITVLLSKSAAEKWARSDEEVSIESEQQIGENGSLKILVEKDFVCVTRKDDPDNAHAFPNPNVNC